MFVLFPKATSYRVHVLRDHFALAISKAVEKEWLLKAMTAFVQAFLKHCSLVVQDCGTLQQIKRRTNGGLSATKSCLGPVSKVVPRSSILSYMQSCFSKINISWTIILRQPESATESFYVVLFVVLRCLFRFKSHVCVPMFGNFRSPVAWIGRSVGHVHTALL